MTSYFDRLVFTILTAWFLQWLQRLGCLAQTSIRTVASLVGDGLFFAVLRVVFTEAGDHPQDGKKQPWLSSHTNEAFGVGIPAELANFIFR